ARRVETHRVQCGRVTLQESDRGAAGVAPRFIHDRTSGASAGPKYPAGSLSGVRLRARATLTPTHTRSRRERPSGTRSRRQAHDPQRFVSLARLPLDQLYRVRRQCIAANRPDVAGAVVQSLEQRLHLCVHCGLCLRTERGTLVVVDEQAAVAAHAEAVDHLTRDAVDLNEVTLRAAGDCVGAEHNLLGHTTAESLDDLPLEVA